MKVNQALMAEERFYLRTYKEADRLGKVFDLQESARASAKLPIWQMNGYHFNRFWNAWGAHGDILRAQRERRWSMRTEQVVRVRAGWREECNGIWHHTRHPGGKFGRRPRSSYKVCDCGSERLNAYLSSVPFVPEKR